MTKKISKCFVLLLLTFSLIAPISRAERIRDIAQVFGVRNNQLLGYGLVVGLDGTGDQTTQTPFTTEAVRAVLTQLVNMTLADGTRMQLKNVAAVVVTAELPPFAEPGAQIDVTVSSLGNAKSLRGGTLLLTQLKAVNGEVYALAQGNIAVGGAGATQNGNTAQTGHLNVGSIRNGGLVERSIATTFNQDDTLYLDLNSADFTTANAISAAINARFPGSAEAQNARRVSVRAPRAGQNRVSFLATIQDLNVRVGPATARVVINSRTGTVVINESVRLYPAAVAHGSLTVSITQTPIVSQPNALSPGQTVVTNATNVSVEPKTGALVQLPNGANLSQVVKALNLLGATPQDLISIIQNLQAAGSLTAELRIE